MRPCDPKVSLGRPAERARVNDQLIFISGGTLRSFPAKVHGFSGFFLILGGVLGGALWGPLCLAAWLLRFSVYVYMFATHSFFLSVVAFTRQQF